MEQKHSVEDIQARVQGACFDAEYATNAVKAMQNSAIHFQNIQDLLKNAMFMKQQISYEDGRKKLGRASPSVSAKGHDKESNEDGDGSSIQNSVRDPAEKLKYEDVDLPEPSKQLSVQ